MRRNTRNSLAALFPSRTGSRRFRAVTMAGPPCRLRSVTARLASRVPRHNTPCFLSRSLSLNGCSAGAY